MAGCHHLTLNLLSSYYPDQGPQKKTSGKFYFKFYIKFLASVVRLSSFWQNELIGMFHKFLQSAPNKCSVFFNTNVFNFNILPWKVTFVISSPSNLILPLVSDQAILLDLSKIGFPNFFQMCRFMIVKSDPESNCNFIFLFGTFTCTYFLMFNPSFSSYFVFFTQLLTFFLARQCELLCLKQLYVGHFLFQ